MCDWGVYDAYYYVFASLAESEGMLKTSDEVVFLSQEKMNWKCPENCNTTETKGQINLFFLYFWKNVQYAPKYKQTGESEELIFFMGSGGELKRNQWLKMW